MTLIGPPVKYFECTNVVKLADHAIIWFSNDSKGFRVLIGMNVAEGEEKEGKVPPADVFRPIVAVLFVVIVVVVSLLRWFGIVTNIAFWFMRKEAAAPG